MVSHSVDNHYPRAGSPSNSSGAKSLQAFCADNRYGKALHALHDARCADVIDAENTKQLRDIHATATQTDTRIWCIHRLPAYWYLSNIEAPKTFPRFMKTVFTPSHASRRTPSLELHAAFLATLQRAPIAPSLGGLTFWLRPLSALKPESPALELNKLVTLIWAGESRILFSLSFLRLLYSRYNQRQSR